MGMTSAPREKQAIGRILSVRGSEARIGLFAEALRLASSADDAALTVGKFIGVARNRLLLVGIINQVSTEVPLVVHEQGYHAVATVDLMGEIIGSEANDARFLRGITSYPAIDDAAVALAQPELRTIYDVDSSTSV